jgi:hypothetical protein
MCFVGQPAEGVGLTGSAEGGAKSHNPREIPLCAGRRFHRSESGRKNRPAAFGMTVGVGANGPWIRAWVIPWPGPREGLAPWCR